MPGGFTLSYAGLPEEQHRGFLCCSIRLRSLDQWRQKWNKALKQSSVSLTSNSSSRSFTSRLKGNFFHCQYFKNNSNFEHLDCSTSLSRKRYKTFGPTLFLISNTYCAPLNPETWRTRTFRRLQAHNLAASLKSALSKIDLLFYVPPPPSHIRMWRWERSM